MVAGFLTGYRLRSGSLVDQALLLKFAYQTYHELFPNEDLSHLTQTVEQYLTERTPIWFVEQEGVIEGLTRAVACMWVGNAIDQVTGDRHAHIFLLYVDSHHRRRGIGTALMRHAETWARARGDHQLGLQVFVANQPAVHLYIGLGFKTQSYWMVKPLHQNDL